MLHKVAPVGVVGNDFDPNAEPFSIIDDQLVKRSMPACLSVELWQPGKLQLASNTGSISPENETVSTVLTGESLQPAKLTKNNDAAKVSKNNMIRVGVFFIK